MKIKLALVSLMVIMLFSFSGCKSLWTQKTVDDINENSNFEIALLTPAGEADFDGFTVLPGFGITGYIDPRYGEFENEELANPHVQYDVTSYPDVLMGESHITGIRITDPAIHIYGYSVGDNGAEFASFLTEKGFDEFSSSLTYMKFRQGKVQIRFGLDNETQAINSLYVGVDSTNHCGVIF
jgi:hypothetical protein